MSARADDASDHAFGSRPPFLVGVEEELFLVDTLTGRLANSGAAVIESLPPISPDEGSVEPELHACQVELISAPRASVSQAIDDLHRMRRAVLETGAGLLGSGTHPSALEPDAEITDKERYERIRDLLGDATATPVGGLHVHVGMPDPGTAIRVFNGLRRHLPLLQALAANSPFRHGRDTGLASARDMTMRAWPRSGVPRAMRDFEDFCATSSLLSRAAGVSDYTWFWWKLRPHPRLGTVEVRALDVQTRTEDTAALAALTLCLARQAADAPPADDLPVEIVEEGLFRAGRWGVGAQLPDAEGKLTSVSELLADALRDIKGHAEDLGCADELDRLTDLVDRGGGAGRQRGWHAIGGMDTLLRELTRASSADPDDGRDTPAR